MTTIPASELVAVNPSVVAASGDGLDLIGLFLTPNTRAPIGSVLSFPTQIAVQNFFGAASFEGALAGIYFTGFNGATKTPSTMLFVQYNQTAVSAYLRGGNISALPIATLNTYNGTLSVTIDGTLKSATVNLAAATTFSNAAEIIGQSLGIEGAAAGVFTGSVGGTFGTCTTSGTTLTLGTVTTGSLWPGDTVTGSDGTNSINTTIVKQLTGAAGGAAGATFQLTAAASPGNMGSATVTAVSSTLNVTGVTSGALAVADVISGTNVPANTYVSGLGTGTGGTGTYTLSGSQFRTTAGAETINAFTPGVTYDSVSGAFVVTSATTGTTSTITFGSGAMATNLLLTQATGATLSQGAAANTATTVSGFMNAIIVQTTNWATFTTTYDPDGGSGSTIKQAFAAWKNAQNNRYGYVAFDNDPTPTTTLPAPASFAQILTNNNDSGTMPQWAPDATTGPEQTAFIMGTVASINFNQPNGRITFAYKNQAGLTATVTTAAAAQNLLGNNYNFYGAYGAAGNTFVWEQDGGCTGPYNWFDSYVNQIWLNNLCQQALLTMMGNNLSIPFNFAGASLIHQTLADPIARGLSFGAFAPGTISSAEIASVNAQANANIAGTLQSQGWYLQVLQQSAAVRKTRGPWLITLWYLDRGSVQSIDLSSVLVQ